MASKKIDKVQQDLFKQKQDEFMQLSKSVDIQSLQTLEDKILAESIEICQHVLNFADMGFEPDGTEIVPDEWENLPLREKEKKIRICKAAWLPSGDAPYGLKAAHATMIAIIKARAARDSGTKVLNIQEAYFPSPSLNNSNVLDVLDVDE